MTDTFCWPANSPPPAVSGATTCQRYYCCTLLCNYPVTTLRGNNPSCYYKQLVCSWCRYGLLTQTCHLWYGRCKTVSTGLRTAPRETIPITDIVMLCLASTLLLKDMAQQPQLHAAVVAAFICRGVEGEFAFRSQRCTPQQALQS